MVIAFFVPEQSSTSRGGDDRPLHSGWLCVDMVDGRVYYWNVHTRQTQWLPRDLVEEDDVSDEFDGEGDPDELLEGHEDEEAMSRFAPGFLLRQACQFILAGRVCPCGTQCTFAHGMSELHPEACG